MSVQLNHTIVNVRDAHASACFMTDILGLPAPRAFAHFIVVDTANGVSLDFLSTTDPIEIAHYAFIVTEPEFDAIFARLQAAGVTWYADPRRAQKGEINHNDGGRGVYFEDPSGHVLEVITRPYGSRG